MSTQLSLELYESILMVIADHYKFRDFSALPDLKHREVLWRHDVDVSLSSALRLAELDRAQSVRSSFFINPNSDFYNVFSPLGSKYVQEIIDLGHAIEIHLDMTIITFANSPSRLALLLSKIRQMFEDSFGVSPSAFSFHNPGPNSETYRDDYYAGLVNCYSNFFRNGVDYVSDSNGYWRFGSPLEFLAKRSRRPLQVLTHGEWWAANHLQPRERMADALFSIAIEHLCNYDKNLEASRRLNISEIESLDLDDSREVIQRTWQLVSESKRNQ